MSKRTASQVEPLLTVVQVAELLGTSERFPRRLIAERRIRFVRIGRHVRIPESALREYIAAGLVDPVSVIRTGKRGDGRAATLRKSSATSVRPMAGALPRPGWQGSHRALHL